MPPSFEEHRDAVRREMASQVYQSSTIQKWTWRIGRRGSYLAVMGFLYLFMGFAYGFMPLPSYTVRQLEMPLMLINDIRVWGVLWMMSGIVALVNSSWPPGRDGPGFVVLWLFSSAWGVLNVLGGVFLDAPRALIMGAVFMVFAATVLIVSGMSDSTPITKAVAKEITDL